MTHPQPLIQQMAGKQHPTIRAVIEQKYRLPDLQSAQKRLNTLKKHFIHSKTQSDDRRELRLWVRDFAVTTPEKKKGFLGHFAIIRIRKSSEGYYTLTAEKDPVDLSSHPQRKRPKQSHPDWGHSILRAVKKGASYRSLEAAQSKLDQLHLEFPNVTIPTNGALHAIVYSKQKNSNARTQKFTFKIETTRDGEFTIKAVKNEYKRRKQEKVASTPAAAEVHGRFTADVVLKNAKKRNA